MKRAASLILFLLLLLHTSVRASEYPESNWYIRATSANGYNGVTLANGRIGMVSGTGPFKVTEMILNGVYDKEYAGGVSQMVRVPNFAHIQLKINGEEVCDSNITQWEQLLHMKDAWLKTSFLYKGTRISYTLRALRNLPYLAMGVIEIEPRQDLELEVTNRTTFSEELQNPRCHFKMMRDLEARMPVFVSESESRTGMHQLATCTSFIFDEKHPNNEAIRKVKGDSLGIRFSRRLKQGQPFRFAWIGAVCASRQFADPKNEAERMVTFAMRQPMDLLIRQHTQLWHQLWESDIIIEGNDTDQQDVRLALYHLYAFQRKGSRLSISPMGLSSSTGYNGHVFWDSELWMFPPIALLHPELAKGHIDYRADRLQAAMRRAEAYGYQGAMFPWESDDSGEESTPTWCLTGTFEHHVTADVGIAFWNYYRITQDKTWLRDEGYPVICKVADFWVSRAEQQADGSFSINRVIGADEYAPHVNDNAFTNGAARVALTSATRAAQVLGISPRKTWNTVASGLRFHYMDNGVIKEHADYDGALIKQADVNLLAYPLCLITDPKAIRRDLEYYQHKIDSVHGPAMGNAILSILYSRLGHPAEAYRFFKKSYMPNKRPPFGVLSESAASDNPYFATGAGGLLQAVLYGFAGFELTDQGIRQHRAILPREWTSLTVKGVGPQKKTYTFHSSL